MAKLKSNSSTLYVDLYDLGLSEEHETFPVCLRICDYTEASFELDGQTLPVHAVGSSVTACVKDLEHWLLDAIVSKVWVQDESELMLVRGSSQGRVWLCWVHCQAGKWRADVNEIDRPGALDTSYALADDDQDQAALGSYHEFVACAAGLTTRVADASTSQVLLRIKVDPKELWFLRFPLGLFARLQFAPFGRYSACQWIVTGRSISETATLQAQTLRELSDTRSFLAGSRIVINTYSAHMRLADAEALTSCAQLLTEVLMYFRDVAFGRDRVTLRWTLNPCPELVHTLLLDKATKFFFADFEADGGIWQVGDGVHRCYDSCDHHVACAGKPRFVELNSLCGRLGHIRLLRIFHCNSIFDPYHQEGAPADDSTIAGQLLNSKALFVEGSATAELPIEFFCMMLRLLLERPDLRTILWAKSLTGTFILGDLIARANALLTNRGYQRIE